MASASDTPALGLEAASPPFTLSRATKDVLFGSMAGMAAKFFEHPFDLVKVRLQTASDSYAGAGDCARQTWAKEGMRGLYRGISMPLLGASFENATLFVTYNSTQSLIRYLSGQSDASTSATATATAAAAAAGTTLPPLSMFQLGIAAAAAGAATSYVLTPIELIKCRMQVQMIAKEQAALTTSSASGGPASASAAIRSLPGPVTLARQVIASEGITGLWLGQTGTLLRETGGGIAWFLAFEATCREFLARRSRTNRPDQKSDLSSIELVTAGAAAGIGYNVILFPADCIKSTIQTEKELKPNQPIAGFLQTGTRIYRQRGIRGLYAGCGITCLRSAPSSALIFLLYSKLEQLADRHGI